MWKLEADEGVGHVMSRLRLRSRCDLVGPDPANDALDPTRSEVDRGEHVAALAALEIVAIELADVDLPNGLGDFGTVLAQESVDADPGNLVAKVCGDVRVGDERFLDHPSHAALLAKRCEKLVQRQSFSAAEDHVVALDALQQFVAQPETADRGFEVQRPLGQAASKECAQVLGRVQCLHQVGAGGPAVNGEQFGNG